MKRINKVMAFTALAIGLSAPLAVFAQGNTPQPFPSTETYPGAENGQCTREYDPVPYVTKDGKTITAPNPCVAAHWKSQGK